MTAGRGHHPKPAVSPSDRGDARGTPLPPSEMDDATSTGVRTGALRTPSATVAGTLLDRPLAIALSCAAAGPPGAARLNTVSRPNHSRRTSCLRKTKKSL